MSRDRRFDVRELAGSADGALESDLGEALLAARAVESALSGPDAVPSPGLADRIMVAVAREPAPHALGILAILRRRPGPGGLAESLRVAWDRAFRGTGRPVGLRAAALAYVAIALVVTVSLTGAAAYATAGALGLFSAPASGAPDATQVVPTPGPLESPSESAEPAESVEPSEVPEPSETAEPDAGEADDDGGSGGGSGVEDDSPYSGEESGATQTPEPTGTPKASQTPRPSSTPDSESSSDD